MHGRSVHVPSLSIISSTPIFFLLLSSLCLFRPSLLISSMMDGVFLLRILAQPQRYIAHRSTVPHRCFPLHLVGAIPPAYSISNALQNLCLNVKVPAVALLKSLRFFLCLVIASSPSVSSSTSTSRPLKLAARGSTLSEAPPVRFLDS